MCFTLNIQEHADELFKSHLVDFDNFCDNPSFLLSEQSVVVKMNGRYLSIQAAIPIIMSLLVFQKPPTFMAMNHIEEAEKQSMEGYSYRRALSSWFARSPSKSPPPQDDDTETSPKKNMPEDGDMTGREDRMGQEERSHQYFKALRPTSDQLKTLNLKSGVNTIKFSVSTSFVTARVFLWSWDDKIVISDIDGTITKSDVLGHVFAVIGKDWTHSVSSHMILVSRGLHPYIPTYSTMDIRFCI